MSKKIFVKKKLSKKNSGKICVQKKFSKKDFGKKILSEKFLVRIFLDQNIFVQTNFLSKKTHQKEFGAKKI